MWPATHLAVLANGGVVVVADAVALGVHPHLTAIALHHGLVAVVAVQNMAQGAFVALVLVVQMLSGAGGGTAVTSIRDDRVDISERECACRPRTLSSPHALHRVKWCVHSSLGLGPASVVWQFWQCAQFSHSHAPAGTVASG